MAKTKEQKRKEAEERQAKYDSLSITDKIKQIAKRPGNSSKELNKLKALDLDILEHKERKIQSYIGSEYITREDKKARKER